MSHLTNIVLLDKPDDYPVQPHCVSMMASPPDRLQVALHLDALGVYELLGDGETRQADLWRVVEYARETGDRQHGATGAARYRVAS